MKGRRRENRGGLSENWENYMNDLPYDETGILFFADEEESAVWAKWGPGVLARWLIERPGTRPSLWWKYEAPRLPAKGIKVFYDGKIPEPRQRVGGVGSTQWDSGENWVPLLPLRPPGLPGLLGVFRPERAPGFRKSSKLFEAARPIDSRGGKNP